MVAWVSHRLELGPSFDSIEWAVTLTSDTSGKWGCGAFWESGWFQLAWSDTACIEEINIATRVNSHCLGSSHVWKGQVVCCHYDNEAVVAVFNRRTSRDQDLSTCCVAFHSLGVMFSFRAIASHIWGAQNYIADDLPRNMLSSFLQAVKPGDVILPGQTTSATAGHVGQHHADWTSQVWQRCSTTLWEWSSTIYKTYQAGILNFVKFCTLLSSALAWGY